MNQLVVSNNCIGTYYYTKALNIRIQTVFAYACVPKSQLQFMVDNLYSIDFSKVQFDVVESNVNFQFKNYIHAKIDRCLDVHYIHYKACELERRKLQYAVRLDRMKSLMSSPHKLAFIFYFNNSRRSPDFLSVDKNDLNLIRQLLNKNNVHICSSNKRLIRAFPEIKPVKYQDRLSSIAKIYKAQLS